MSLASARELIPARALSLPAATVLPCTALGEALRHAAHKLGSKANESEHDEEVSSSIGYLRIVKSFLYIRRLNGVRRFEHQQ